MARIPLIEQQTNLSVSQPSPQATAPQIISPFGDAFRVAAQGFDEIAHAQVKMQNALTMKENADAVANLAKPMSDSQLYWADQLKTLSQQTTDGGLIKQPDGSTIELTAKIQKDFDAWSGPFIDGIQNTKAREMAMSHIGTLRTQVIGQAMTAQASAAIANRVEKLNEMVVGLSSTAAGAKDLTQIDALVKQAQDFINASGFDEKTKAEKMRTATLSIIEAANQGAMERDPIGYKAAALQRYGIDPQAPNAPVVSAAGGGGFNSSVAFTLQHEGGYSPADSNGAPVNFGINQAANPDIDVKNLTKAGAAQIYKQRYWDAIKGDELAAKNPALATMAFDTAVMSGAGKAKELIDASGGDPAKFMAMREQFLQGLLQKDPAKYGPFAKAWADRNADLRTATGLPGGSAYTPPPPIDPAMAALVSKLPVEKLPGYITSANTQVNQQQAVFKAQIATTEGDHVAAYMNGQMVPKPLTVQDYTKAYGPIEGPQRYANYQQVQQLGGDLATMKTMPPPQMSALLDSYRAAADPAKPGYELALKRYQTVAQAADQVNQARQVDPIDYAVRNAIGGAQSLDFTNVDKFVSTVASRAGVAKTMQDTYQTPFMMLTKAEASTLSTAFQTMTTSQRLAYISAMQGAIKDPAAYRAVLQQVAPDSPVTAMAGMILNKPQPVVVPGFMGLGSDTTYNQRDVASLMLEGEALINPNKADTKSNGVGKEFPLPKDQDMRLQFTNTVGNAFAGDPKGADFAYQAVKAYYAGKSARVGDVTGTIDNGRMTEAVNAVLGGVSDVNGKGKVVRPWGMSEPLFKDRAKQAFDQAIDAAGYKGTRADNFGIYGLQSAGDGKYLLRNGTSYLNGPDDQPIVITIDQSAPKSSPAIVPNIIPVPSVVQPKTTKPDLERPKTK